MDSKDGVEEWSIEQVGFWANNWARNKSDCVNLASDLIEQNVNGRALVDLNTGNNT